MPAVAIEVNPEALAAIAAIMVGEGKVSLETRGMEAPKIGDREGEFIPDVQDFLGLGLQPGVVMARRDLVAGDSPLLNLDTEVKSSLEAKDKGKRAPKREDYKSIEEYMGAYNEYLKEQEADRSTRAKATRGLLDPKYWRGHSESEGG